MTMKRTDEGFRYIRCYRLSGDRVRWALWERREGRMRRVGTAVTEDAYRDFLFERGDWTRTTLTLEIKDQRDTTYRNGPVIGTPDIDEDYWVYRVKLSDTQAIIGFPKFNTIGIGFAVEDNWNTNLPYTCSATEIYHHIKQNKGNDNISPTDCLTAITMIQESVRHIKDFMTV